MKPSSRKDGQTGETRFSFGMTLCAACALVVLFILQCHIAGALPISAREHRSVDIQSMVPFPSEPYEYEHFMSWVRSTNFSSVHGLKLLPDPAEYDIDAVTGGKFGSWLVGEAGATAMRTAKLINRYVFTQQMLRDGVMTTMGAPGLHVYILRQLLPAASGPQPTFLDAGCGTGYLLMGWALSAGPGSRAVGIDVSSSGVADARRYLADSRAVDSHAPVHGTTVVLEGNAFAPDAASLKVAPGSVDAVNVGAAVSNVEELSALAALLRTGGLLAVPVCDAEQPADVKGGSCAARFEIFTKDSSGTLQRTADNPGIPVRFVRATRSSGASGGGFLAARAVPSGGGV